MLIKANTLKGYRLDASDGEIGRAKEFYFDDLNWVVRYLVADTGNWLTGSQILISPNAMGSANNLTEHINVHLTKNQIEKCPSLLSDKPVSRQFEKEYFGYYGWPSYWSGLNMLENYPDTMHDTKDFKPVNQHKNSGNPHLRSTNAVSGYNIQADEGEIGHVADFIIDSKTWAIRYLMIDTTNWIGGKKVLISPKWIDHISWKECKVFINLSRESIKQSPEYTEEALLTRDYETQLHKYYNQHVYWPEDPMLTKQML